MLNRDFSKSNKEYFKKNRFILIGVAVFLILGVLFGIIFGMNGNFEIKGCHEFTIEVSEEKSKDFNKYSNKVGEIVNSFGGDLDSILYAGEGDSTVWIVRYAENLSDENQTKVNEKISAVLEINIEKISDHVFVKPIVKSTDYVFTAVAVLLVLTIASVFAYFRYNGASAVVIIIACLLGTLGFISFGSILRLTIGMSYFAMIAILNLLIVYLCFALFENIREENWLATKEYSKAINSAIERSKFRMCVMSVAIMLIGVLFAICAPATLKYVSLNIMFMAVVLLAVVSYVVPFVWNVLITSSRIKEHKVKASDVNDK